MEIPESLPLLGWASRVRGHDDQRNRMENRLESNRERRACPLDRDSSQTSIPRGFFPYAIALLRGGSRKGFLHGIKLGA